jgi:hypothetical protein
VCDVGFVVKLSARALRRAAAAARKQRRAPNRWSRAAWSGKQLEAARPEFLVVGRARISLVGGVKPEQGARGKDLGEKSPPPRHVGPAEGGRGQCVGHNGAPGSCGSDAQRG